MEEKMKGWTEANIPSLAGRLAVVTGTGGLGYETALGLARAGAAVVLAGRSPERGRTAVARIQTEVPAAKVSFELLDLASLASVERFAGRINSRSLAIDILVNNAGVMALPRRRLTEDGFEMQIGTNYLGHFALTARLMPSLQESRSPRVIEISSGFHRVGRISLDDLGLERGYGPWRAYAQSKLAMLIFAFELQRRSDGGGWGLLSLAAHPGYARTELIANGPGAGGFFGMFGRTLGRLVSQSAPEGALPTLLAATLADARPGAYYGPTGPLELTGAPGVARVSPRARNADVSRRLWDLSVGLTGVRWP